jgi:glycosyltransferase involved in cell wall biosynthesis
MPGKTGYIISLKFAPGLKKEFTLIGEKLRQKGLNINYLLAKNYQFIGNNVPQMEFISDSNNLKEVLLDSVKFLATKRLQHYFNGDRELSFILFYNFHILNLIIARFLKERGEETATVLYLHDPYKPDKKPYGVAKGTYIALIECIQKMIIKYIDHVICASEYSYALFRNHYKNYRGAVHIAPLLVPDQSHTKALKREFFSIVGGYHKGTGHDTFINLVNYAASQRLGFKFALITSSNINELLSKLSPAGRNCLEIINRKIIDDDEINDIILRSYAVFRLDREVTQSGVIPVSYMNGTPIIACDIPGLSQHVRHGQTGYITPLHDSPAELLNAMNLIIKNFAELSQNARNSYEEVWSEKNFDKYYYWLSSP